MKDLILYPIPGIYDGGKKFDISVIVPMYKSRKVIADQIRRFPTIDKNLNVELIYVDDRCPEKSKQEIMQGWKKRPDHQEFCVKLIVSQKNRGFGGACNLGAHHAKGRLLLFLNADTVPEPNWLQPIVDAFDDAEVGIVGNLQLKDGGEHHGTIDGIGSEWTWDDTNFLHIGRHTLNNEPLEKPLTFDDLPAEYKVLREREMATGCCLAIRKSLFDYVGGFDNRYKIGYWEDSEINMAVRELGYKVVIEPKSIVWHRLSHAKVGKHPYAEANRQLFMNKWVTSGRLRRLVKAKMSTNIYKIKKILVKRMGANGDVLIAAGVLPLLKKKFPDAQIHFSTYCPEILYDNPFVDKIISEQEANQNQHKYHYVVDLDGAYERRPLVPFTNAYAEEAGFQAKDMEFFLRADAVDLGLENYVVIHAGMTAWPGRNWHGEKFEKIAKKLLDTGQNVVCIGVGSDRPVTCTADVRGKLSIHQTAGVIAKSRLFIGIDSMPMNMAQVLNVPGVAFFGCIDPKSRIFRKNMTGVTADDLQCLGCHHRQLAPRTSLDQCETGTFDCENLVSDIKMWKVIEGKLCLQNI